MASEQVDDREDNRPSSDPESGDENSESCDTVSPDALIKHPLQFKWALWFYKNDKTKNWVSNLKLVTTFDTVEDFWSLYNHVQRASKIPYGCDYSMFKDGIQPMWEDKQNQRGGRWVINLNRQQRPSELDHLWQETLLCLIGEAFDEMSFIVCGAVVSVRNKGNKLGLWTRDAGNEDANKKIGQKLKERLHIPPKISIGYQVHEDTSKKSGSPARDRYIL
ncbi:eukaryotic translation initiation factor 4E-like [Argonauta hians]